MKLYIYTIQMKLLRIGFNFQWISNLAYLILLAIREVWCYYPVLLCDADSFRSARIDTVFMTSYNIMSWEIVAIGTYLTQSVIIRYLIFRPAIIHII